MQTTASLLCEAPATFADQARPRETRHVAVSGSDETGDGSTDHPYLTLARAVRGIGGGTAIHLHAGRYSGRAFLVDLHGTAEAPIWIMGAPGETRPTIEGGPEGLHLVQPRFVVVEHLEISGTADNGINVDDGDETSNPEAARYVLFRDIDVHDTGKNPSGIAACLKLAGVSDVTIAGSRFARCGSGPMSGATGVDGVGVHRATVVRNQFTSVGFGAIQFKGGSADVEVRANVMVDAGWRGVNMGGSTGEHLFRPPTRFARRDRSKRVLFPTRRPQRRRRHQRWGTNRFRQLLAGRQRLVRARRSVRLAPPSSGVRRRRTPVDDRRRSALRRSAGQRFPCDGAPGA